jgi:hypothetical protein
VSESREAPLPYRVVYSERVRNELKDLLREAAARGLGPATLDAVKALDARLRLYPQFGEPLLDLKTEGETLWTGTIPPLVVQYIIDDARRLVFGVVPIKPLPGSGLEGMPPGT